MPVFHVGRLGAGGTTLGTTGTRNSNPSPQFVWSDTDNVLQTMGQAYYWLRLDPSAALGTSKVVGPQFVLLNPSLLPPLALSAVSASHAAAVNGTVLVTVNVSAIPNGDSVKIYVSGYQANANYVAIAQKSSGPIQFTLQQTGETVTIKAIAVTAGGAEAGSGPVCTLTLNNTATVPAQVQNVQVAQIATGNQVQWPSSLEAGVTSYQLYRGVRGLGFGSASLLATITATSAGQVIYLDTAGLTGDWEYYVIAVSGSGNSPQSAAANALVLLTSAVIPNNVPTNTNNNATSDSIDAGTSATIRVYGPGGAGTGWTRYTGYGTVARPAGSITGLAYSTAYYVMYSSGNYVASTSFYSVLPDGYEWVGKVTTVAAGGGGGTAGGGGFSGPSGGCVEVGTEVIEPEGTVQVLEPCDEWVCLDLGKGELKMHPETLVSVWKKAHELTPYDRVEVAGARWQHPANLRHEQRASVKVKRTCPGGTYHAGPSKVRLHNVKVN